MTSRQQTWSKLANIIHFDDPIQHFQDMMIYMYAKPKNRSYEETHPAYFVTEYGTFSMPQRKPEHSPQIVVHEFAAAIKAKVLTYLNKREVRKNDLEKGV
jgi:hypothetical protein